MADISLFGKLVPEYMDGNSTGPVADAGAIDGRTNALKGWQLETFTFELQDGTTVTKTFLVKISS